MGNALSALDLELLRLGKATEGADRLQAAFANLAGDIDAGRRDEAGRLLGSLREAVLGRAFPRVLAAQTALGEIKGRMVRVKAFEANLAPASAEHVLADVTGRIAARDISQDDPITGDKLLPRGVTASGLPSLVEPGKRAVTVKGTKAMEKALERSVFWRVPNDYKTTLTAINQGKTLLETAPKAPVTKSLRDLARALVPFEEAKEPKHLFGLKFLGGHKG